MKQRLGIGRSLLGRPRLLVLDEPTNGMDPGGYGGNPFVPPRREIRSDGLTVFVSSHLMSEVEEFCDTVFVINHGRLVASGSVREILRPRERVVRVVFQGRLPAPDFLRGLEGIRRVEGAGADLRTEAGGRQHGLAERTPFGERIQHCGYHPEEENVERVLPRHYERTDPSAAPLCFCSATKSPRRGAASCPTSACSPSPCSACWSMPWPIDSAAARPTVGRYAAFPCGLYSCFNDIGLIFIIVFSAMLVSEETGTGTIRAALAAPVQRWELYLAKAATGLLYMLFLSATALLFWWSWPESTITLGRWMTLTGLSMGGAGFQLPPGMDVGLDPLTALVMYGLFISTLVRGSGAAVAVGIGTLYLLEFSKHLVGLDPYIFTRHIELPWIILQQAAQGVDYQWQPEVWKMLGLSGAYTATFFGAGLVTFVRQEFELSLESPRRICFFTLRPTFCTRRW